MEAREEKEKETPDVGAELGRRDFLGRLFFGGGMIAAAVGFVLAALRFIVPPRKPPRERKILVAHEDEMPVGKAKSMEIAGQKVFVVHLSEGYRVLSAVCTHLGCIVEWQEDKQRFFCPCHKGVYDREGKVVSGPPPEPLPSFRIEVDKGLVYVWIPEKQTGGLA